jgi:dTDP-4-amino-4,6-dideoxygalactose transaminase
MTARHSSEPIYLIEPEPLGDLDSVLAAIAGILAGERADYASLFGPQRYLVKGVHKLAYGFRGLLEQSVLRFLGLPPERWSLFAVTSGTAALRLAVRALLERARDGRDQIVIPAVTVANTAEAVLMEGFHPVLADVDPETWVIDTESAARAISARTAAIVSVDWLGTGVDPGRLRAFARDHGLTWISDSAQSFGIGPPGASPAAHADAAIWSTGYPKVFHTGGRGGLLLLPRAAATALAADPAGSLRNEPLAEINALLGLHLLPRFGASLARRREIGQRYRRALGELPGFSFQRLSSRENTNSYQMTLVVDPGAARITAGEIAAELARMGIHASTERMPCLGEVEPMKGHLAQPVPLPVSASLAARSLTLPMPSSLSEAACQSICDAIARLHGERRARCHPPAGTACPDAAADRPRAISNADLLLRASATSQYWSIEDGPVLYTANGRPRVAERVLAPPDLLRDGSIPVAAVLAALRGAALYPGRTVSPPLTVQALTAEGDIILGGGEARGLGELIECGSSARVCLWLSPEGELLVRKSCSSDGIDGNGKPWLKHQAEYLAVGASAGFADLFVQLREVCEESNEIVITMPCVEASSPIEDLLGGADAEGILELLGQVYEALARTVWRAGITTSRGDYLQRVHLGRMRRRLGIAASRHQELRQLLTLPEVEFNGRSLASFETLGRRLEDSGILAALNPRRLSFIHGDLNLFNILNLHDPSAPRPFKLIDPRGTPLWTEDPGSAAVERGDFVYDLAKSKFSLSGFACIRLRLARLETCGKGSFALTIHADHPATRAIATCDSRFFDLLRRTPGLAALREALLEADSDRWEARLELAEAANFVADAACALGRNRSDEVLPLFLLGLDKLDRFCERHCAAPVPRRRLARSASPAEPPSVPPAGEGPGCGLVAIRDGLLAMAERAPWDLIEVVVARDAVPLARRVLGEALGVYLPLQTSIHLGHHPYPALSATGPLVLLHATGGGGGQLDALATAVVRTREFLLRQGRREEDIGHLRILTLVPGAAADRESLLSRAGEPLLAAAPRNLTPLLLAIELSHQLPYPRPGRWVLTGTSLFLAARPIEISGARLAAYLADPCAARAVEPWEGEAELASAVTFLPPAVAAALAVWSREHGQTRASIVRGLLAPYRQQLAMSENRHPARTVDVAAADRELSSWWRRLLALSPSLEWAPAGERRLFRSLATLDGYLACFAEADGDPWLRSLLKLPSTLAALAPTSGRPLLRCDAPGRERQRQDEESEAG